MAQPVEARESLLAAIPASKQVNLSWSLSAFVPVLVQASSTKDDVESPKYSKERQILYDLEGAVDPGQLLALMGPSGSGKSSLLSALGGRSAARIAGTITFNGQPLNKAVQRKLGFVTQDDLLFGELTTYETLYFAALLRLPRSWGRDAKLARVEMVLQGLGLDKCRDTIIGNHQMRGVSGGERKRVSIGHELLINPSVIFLDEPTSGLDSTTALKLVHTLRSLASGGRTIVASIHQPSSRLYQEFDKLMLLSEGHTMYYGSAHAAAQWFGLHGAPVPFEVSTPDHLLDVACADLPGATHEQSEQLRKGLIEAYRTRNAGKGRHGIQPPDVKTLAAAAIDAGHQGSDAHVHVSSSTKQAAEQDDGIHALIAESDSRGSSATSMTLATRKLASQTNLHCVLEVQSMSTAAGDVSSGSQPRAQEEDEQGAPWWQQVKVLITRCVRTRRFNALSYQRFVEVLLPALICGLFWWQVGGKNKELSKQDVLDVSGLLFFQIIFMSWSAMFQALLHFSGEMHMLVKERQSGMYRLSALYLARSVSDIPMDCLLPTIFTFVAYWMTGLRVTPGAFFCNWLTILLTMLVGQSAGLLLGAGLSNVRTCMAVSTVFLLCTILVSGFFVKDIPVWISWLKYGSFVYYGFSMLLKIENHDRGYLCADFYADHPDAPPGKTWCSIAEGDFLGINVNASVGRDVGVLLAMLVAVRTLTYIVLNKRTGFKQKQQ